MTTERIHYEWKVIHGGDGKTPNIRLNSASWVYKDNIWLVCGSGSGSGKSSEVWRYSFNDKIWESIKYKGDPPSPRDGHTGTYIGDGKFVVFGGQGFQERNPKVDGNSEANKTKTFAKRDLFNDLLQFDCETFMWSPIYPDGLHFPMGRRGHAAVYINSTTHGGLVGSNFIGDDSSVDTYSCTNSIVSSSSATVRTPYSRAQPQLLNAVQVPVNTLLVFGGAGIEQSKYAEQLYNDLWSFSFADNCWTKLETFGTEPLPVFDHRVVVVQDLLVAVGGITGTLKPANPALMERGGASSSVSSPSDVMVLNLRTSTWSALKLWDQYGQPSRFNFHGFSLVPDANSSSSAQNSNGSLLFVFGGNQVADSKSASTKGGPSLPWAYPDDYTLVLNLRDCTLLPVSCVQEVASPENRYGHTGVPCLSVDQLFAQQLMSSRDKPKKPEKTKTRLTLLDAQPEQQTFEPIMFVYGGASVDRGGYPDPMLYQLVRVRTEINETLLTTLINPDQAKTDLGSSDVPMLSPFADLVNESQEADSPFPSRPGSPSSFPDGLSSSGALSRGLGGRRENIWHNMQTKIGHKGDVRPPCNWAEMKLSLTAPFSQRVFETDRFENEAVFDHLQHSLDRSTGDWRKRSSGEGKRSTSLAMRGSQSAPVLGGLDSLRTNTLLNSRMAHSRTGTAMGRSRVSTGRGDPSELQLSATFSRSTLRPHTVGGLSPLAHSLKGSSSPAEHGHSSSNDEFRDRLRKERSDRVHLIRATLQPIVKHQTKVAAKEQYLKLFPVHQNEHFA